MLPYSDQQTGFTLGGPIIRDRVQAMMKKGMTLDQIKAAKPTGQTPMSMAQQGALGKSLVLFVIVVGAFLEQLGCTADRRERRLELVSDVGGELGNVALALLEPARHLVEFLRQLADFAAASERHVHAALARPDASSRARQPFERA